MGRMLGPRYQKALILQAHHDRREPALCTVGPCMEWLTKHDAAGACSDEGHHRRVVDGKLCGEDGDGDVAGKGIEIICEFTTGNCPGPSVVALEPFNLGPNYWCVGRAKVVYGPMVRTGD